MELLLNLIWATLVVAAALQFARWSCGQPNGRRRRIVALATICVLALLFPIISVTDDLHPTTAVLEDANGVRRTATILFGHVQAPLTGLVAVLLIVATLSMSQPQLSAIATIVADPPRHVREGIRVTAGIRPPPASLV